MTSLPLHILRHEEEMAVAVVPRGETPSWEISGPITSTTTVGADTSVLCAAAAVPDDVRALRGFVAFEVAGPLDFSVVGIIASLVDPLALGRVPVMTTSTIDTVWVLVPGEHSETAQRAWREHGFFVTTTSLGRLGRPDAPDDAAGTEEERP